MTEEDLNRIAVAAAYTRRVPDELAGELAQAIAGYLQDQAGRPLDFWLSLPARRYPLELDVATRRAQAYRDYAETLDGSTDYRAARILDDVDGWLVGDLDPDDVSAEFATFLRHFSCLRLPHLRRRSLRRVIG